MIPVRLSFDIAYVSVYQHTYLFLSLVGVLLLKRLVVDLQYASPEGLLLV